MKRVHFGVLGVLTVAVLLAARGARLRREQRVEPIYELAARIIGTDRPHAVSFFLLVEGADPSPQMLAYLTAKGVQVYPASRVTDPGIKTPCLKLESIEFETPNYCHVNYSGDIKIYDRQITMSFHEGRWHWEPDSGAIVE